MWNLRNNCVMQGLSNDQRRRPRPASSSVSLATVGMVFFGGALGVGARHAFTQVLPASGPFEWGVLAANLTGALLIGVVAAVLLEADTRRAIRLRQLLIAGMLGGFTTYSGIVLAVVLLIEGGHLLPALGYALGTVILGGILTWLGVIVGAQIRTSRRKRAARG